jgi:uncharacterized caspase-like protein
VTPRRALLLAALLAVAGSAQAQAPPIAERPVYTTGQRWVRSDGVFELVRIEKDRYVFATGPQQEVHLTKDLAIARTRRGQRFNEIDPPIALKWPLEVGTWGLQNSVWRWTDKPNGVPAKLIWRVMAYEDVRVPAGAFKAFRIDMQVELSASWNKTFTAWYAPAVRQYVKGGPGGMFFLDTFDVVSVDVPAPLRITLAQPAEAAQVASAETRLTGRVSGDALARVEIALNGAEVASLAAERGEPIALDVPLRLEPGKNTILVTAVDRSGERRQESRIVHRRPAEPPRPPAAARTAPPAPAATAAAVTIAVSEPAHRSTVEHDTVALAGIASAPRGVARVVVSLNGAEIARHDETPPRPAVPVNVPLRLREGPNTVVVTVADAAGALQQEIRSVQYERPVPFSIALRYPEDRSRTAEAASVVAAVVESSKGVAKVQVVLNGTEVHQEAGRPGERSMVVTAPVTLRPGPNTVVVRATQADGGVRQELRTVVYDPPRVAAAPPPAVAAPAPARNQWAVVIGVGRYESVGIPRLRYTVADAEAIYETLVGAAGFRKDNVLLLTDRSERKPTLRNIKWALGTFLGRSAQKDDTVLIFFAGHGAPEVDTRGLERDGLAKYLIPSDADPDDLFSTALPMDDLQTIFGRIEAERVVAFLDACYSGAAGGRTFASKKTRAGAVDDLFLERLTRSKGRAIITASRPAEVSIELPELGHGIFSYYLVGGLKGAADLNRDGIVSLQELYEYLEQQVTAKSRAVGGNQHPVMKGELEGVLPLTKVKVKGR